MNKKMYLAMLLIVSLFPLSSFFPVHADTTNLYLSPSSTTGLHIGDNVSMTINVQNVQNLYQWKTCILFDYTKLQFVSAVENTAAVKSVGQTLFQVSATTGSRYRPGNISEISTTLLTSTLYSNTGSIVLATITFKVLAETTGTGTTVQIANRIPYPQWFDFMNNNTIIRPDSWLKTTNPSHLQEHPLIPFTITSNAVVSTGTGPSSTGTINFHITDSTTSQALSGATITSTGSPSFSSGPTDTSGNYIVSNLPIGTYTFSVSKTGYTTITGQSITISSGTLSPTSSLSLTPSGTGSLTADAGSDQSVLKGTLVSLHGSSSGTGVTYKWTFTDGSAKTLNGQDVTYRYNRTGVYTITLTVTDNQSLTATDTVQITVRDTTPIAVILIDKINSANETSVNMSIKFDGSGSSDPAGGTITSYSWTFGDGKTAAGSIVTHTYNTTGTFTIKLKITVTSGAPAEKTKIIKVLQNAVFDVDHSPPKVRIYVKGLDETNTTVTGNTVYFKGGNSTDNSGAIVKYTWDFGDGAFAYGVNAQHTYSLQGPFRVTLECKDRSGNVGTGSVFFNVYKPKVKGSLSIDLYRSGDVDNGKGLNKSAGDLEPFQDVTLYAKVMRSGSYKTSQMVTFQVRGPQTDGQFRIFRGILTDSNGTAALHFKIPAVNERNPKSVLGNWTCQAYTEYYDEYANDTMGFKVAWAFSPEDAVSKGNLNITLTDGNEVVTSLVNGGDSKFLLKLNNPSKTVRRENITIEVVDSQGNVVMMKRIDNVVVNGTSLRSLQLDFQVPMNAAQGKATVRISAAPANYASNADIVLLEAGSFQIYKRDLCIRYATPLAKNVMVGEPLNVTLAIENLGDLEETSNVTLFRFGIAMTRIPIKIGAGAVKLLSISINTTKLQQGNYTFTARLTPVRGEFSTDDNNISLGVVQIKSAQSTQVVEWFSLVSVITGTTTIVGLVSLFRKKPF